MGTSRVRRTHPRTRRTALIVTAGAAALTMSACAGGVAESSGADAGTGVEARAEFSAYQEALADMEPVTLTYQPSAQSADGMDGYRDIEFKENVEEASGGKITIDIVYAQAIAGYPEIPDALTDGRIDLAYTLPLYDPSRFPVNSALVAGSALTGASPRAEELAANAAMLDVAWNTPELLEEMETNGIVPLIPFNADGTVFSMCADPGNSAEDWNGRQVRISSAAQEKQLPAMNASPVSLEYLETYEALQRKTVDCTLSAALPAYNVGFLEVAPHISYSEKASFARGAGAIVAGSGYEELPLAARQLIFDQMAEVFKHSRRSNINANAEAAKVALEKGGGFESFDEETEQALVEASNGLAAEQVEAGLVSEGFDQQITDALEKWRGVVEEMGLADEGGFEDLADWHDDEAVDLMPFSERVYEEVMMEHRPQ
jgi:TRAP-type C4-dicarboxylate transport system substrate-binding protein